MPQATQSSQDFPLCAYLDEQVEAIRTHVPPALSAFEEKGIHQARVGTRRLKAALELLAPVLPEAPLKRFSKLGKKLRRRLGPLRDLDVMIGHLQAMRQGPARHPAAVDWALRSFEQQREATRREQADLPPASRVLEKLGMWWGLRPSVLEAREASASLLAESLHQQLDDFSHQADALAAAEAQVKEQSHPLDPHELRIAGKALRYTLEMAKEEGHPLPAGVLKSFKRMQEALGQWHDSVVLAERCMRQCTDDLLPHHNAALTRQVLGLTRDCLQRSERELKTFARLWKRSGPKLAQTIRQALPLTRPAAAPQASATPAEPAANSTSISLETAE